MAVWKLTNNDWLNNWAKQFVEFSSELDSEACNLTEVDKIKARKMMTSFRLMFNRYAKNK